jgi:hypothetical protein
MNSMSVVMPSFHQRDLTLNCLKSYLHFCPKDFNLKIIVVENSDDVSYKEEALALGENIIWVNNNTHLRYSNANSVGIEVGMKYVEDDYVFLSHNDVCITSSHFFTSLIEKVAEGNQLIGTCYDMHPLRNKCIIMLGCLVTSSIVRKVDLYLLNREDGSPHFEAGDRINIHCRENNIKHLCFENTYNDEKLRETLVSPYKDLLYTVITVDHHGNVIFLHFARGSDKTTGRYTKSGRKSIPEIIEFCESNIFKNAL